jgi:hypothetical protein
VTTNKQTNKQMLLLESRYRYTYTQNTLVETSD